MGMRSVQDSDPLAGSSQFATRLPGKIAFPSDSTYDMARSAWNLIVDQYPKVIVYVENSLDVIEAVSFARQNGLKIAVQSTGHGVIRKADGAMLINTSRMKDLQIDPQAQTAWVGAGVKWGEILEKAHQHGLAPLLGSSPDVGAVGYTLGGGMGWLVRKYGTSADSVLRMEVVTPDGVFRRVSKDENSDLFWALCGGGGGFGVVTGMEIRLHPVAQVYAGNLFYPPEMTKEVFRRFRQWVEDAPDELTAAVVLMNFPPLPELPPFLSGQSFVIVRGCYAGSIEQGENLLEFWRSWQTPMMDDFKTMPFSEAGSISQDPEDPIPIMVSGAWLSDLPEEAANAMIEYTLPQGGPPALIFTEVRHAGGAISRVDPDSNAFSHRDGKFVWASLGVVMNPEMADQLTRHFNQMHSALACCLTGKTYVNFTHGDEALRRSRDGYSEKNFRRLQTIKARYDPENIMNHSYDIPPMK